MYNHNHAAIGFQIEKASDKNSRHADSIFTIYMDNLCLQTWMHLDEDYQELSRQLESVEGSIPTVGLVEETEDRLTDRITLFQVGAF